jgi:hypothetical protein
VVIMRLSGFVLQLLAQIFAKAQLNSCFEY